MAILLCVKVILKIVTMVVIANVTSTMHFTILPTLLSRSYFIHSTQQKLMFYAAITMKVGSALHHICGKFLK
jgi:predicted cobalt transporter CbtA